MNYEEKLREIINSNSEYYPSEDKAIFAKYFPELKESEDERIRKGIIRNLQYLMDSSEGFVKEDLQERIVWLEKQCEQAKFEPNSAWSEKDEEMLKWLCRIIHTQRLDKAITLKEESELGEWIDKWLNYNLQTKQSEQSTDKIKPKFHEDDWIIFNGSILHIDEVVNGYYRTTSIGDGIHNSYDWNIDNAARLWTIQDAKEGDVLANNHNILILKELDYDWSCNGTPNAVKAYCDIKPNGNFEIGKDNWCFCGTLYIHPATKEQRDTLFAKMADAGYKWNSEKKELRKVEQKPADKPKFKVGDWFVNNNRKDVFLIKSINTNGYCTLEDIKGNIISPCLPPCESDSHIWTIEDAKDGDVLTNSKIIVIFKQIVEPKYKQHIEAYIGLDLGCDIQVTSEFWSLGIDKAMPATKEQCDLLFSKMKEAGYEWDSEKKELKRIEPKKLMLIR